MENSEPYVYKATEIRSHTSIFSDWATMGKTQMQSTDLVHILCMAGYRCQNSYFSHGL